MFNSGFFRVHPLLRVLIYLFGNFCIIFLLQLLVSGTLPSGGTVFNSLMSLSVLLFYLVDIAA